MSKCVTHSDQFIATDDMLLNPDDAFKASEMRLRTLTFLKTKYDKAAKLSLLKKEKEAL